MTQGRDEVSFAAVAAGRRSNRCSTVHRSWGSAARLSRLSVALCTLIAWTPALRAAHRPGGRAGARRGAACLVLVARNRAAAADAARAAAERHGDRCAPTRRACAPSAAGLLERLDELGRAARPRRRSGCARAEAAAAAAHGGAAERAGGAAPGARSCSPRRDSGAEAGVLRAVGRRAGAQQRAVRGARRGPASRRPRPRSRPRPMATPPSRAARDRQAARPDGRPRCSASRGSCARSRRSASRPTRGCASRSAPWPPARTQLRSETKAAGQRTARAAGARPLGRAAAGAHRAAGRHGGALRLLHPGRRAGRGRRRAARHGRAPGRRQAGRGRREGAVRRRTWRPSRASDADVHTERLAAHARQLRQHVDQLAAKAYWAAFAPSPEFVVLFVPGDPFLEAALQADPSLMEHAFAHNVVIATPTTLIALLRTVAYSWRQEALARNAAQVHQLGKELHGRLATMGTHVAKLGRSLDAAVDSYNRTVSSLEARVLVTARKLTELQVADEELPEPVRSSARPARLSAPELVASAADSLIALHDVVRPAPNCAATAPAGDGTTRVDPVRDAASRTRRRRPSGYRAPVDRASSGTWASARSSPSVLGLPPLVASRRAGPDRARRARRPDAHGHARHRLHRLLRRGLRAGGGLGAPRRAVLAGGGSRRCCWRSRCRSSCCSPARRKPGAGMAERLLVIGAPLVNAFPTMAWTTGARAGARPVPAGGSGAASRRCRSRRAVPSGRPGRRRERDAARAAARTSASPRRS